MIRTPSELALHFNLCHEGQQVTHQAVQKWLSGASKPSPEKIETLARLCQVSAQWLRYGIPENSAPPSPPQMTPSPAEEELPPAEALLLQRFRALSAHQQTLISDLVAQLGLNKEIWGESRKLNRRKILT